MCNNPVAPENTSNLPLPPKSSELNPVENHLLIMRDSQPWRIMSIGWALGFDR